MYSDLGIIAGFDKRSVQIRSEYNDRLVKAKKHIDILGFGLPDFRRDYVDQLPDLASRARVRILLIDPSPPAPGVSYCEQRDREEDRTLGTIAGQVNELLDSVRRLPVKPQEDRLEIRLYSSLPLVNLFRIDDEIIWGPFL